MSLGIYEKYNSFCNRYDLWTETWWGGVAHIAISMGMSLKTAQRFIRVEEAKEVCQEYTLDASRYM